MKEVTKMKKILKVFEWLGNTYIENAREVNLILLGEAIGLTLAVGMFFLFILIKMVTFS
jgi:hypothetical protein